MLQIKRKTSPNQTKNVAKNPTKNAANETKYVREKNLFQFPNPKT